MSHGHINDGYLASTGGPTVSDGKLAYYLANGATSLNVNDAEREFLLANGAGYTESPELVTDFSFAAPASWTAGPGWEVLGGNALADGTNAAKSTLTSKTSITLTNGKRYIFTIGIADINSGEVEVGLGAFRLGVVFDTQGIHTATKTNNSGGNLNGGPLLDAAIGTSMQINFFSIKEQLTGNIEQHINDLWEYYLRVVKGYTGALDDMKLKFWSAALGADLVDQEVLGAELTTNGDFSAWTADNPDWWTASGESGSDPMFTQVAPSGAPGTGACRCYRTQPGVMHLNKDSLLTVGKVYKVEFDLVVVAGGLSISNYGNTLESIPGYGIFTTSGRKTAYFTAISSIIYFYPDYNGADVTIDNITIKEVTAPAKGQFEVDAMIAGSAEKISNGLFDSDTSWTKGTGWTIADGEAKKTAGTFSDLYQSNIFGNDGKLLKITIRVRHQAGNVRVAGCGIDFPWVFGSGTFHFFLFNDTPGDTYFYISGDEFFVGSVDNVSIREVRTAWQRYGTNQLSIDPAEGNGGALKITGDGSNTNGMFVFLANAADLTADLVVGQKYQIKFTGKVSAGGSVDFGVYYNDHWIEKTAVTGNELHEHILEFTAEHATQSQLAVGRADLASGESAWIDDIVLQKMGASSAQYPAP
jgi:hypothetical protein